MMTTYWKSLDGLRAIAVMLVILSHTQAGLVKNGGVGVDVFFVLSGFLITGILSREFFISSRLNFRNFYMRRVLRLVPCLLLACGLYVVTSVVFRRQIPLMELGLVITYTTNWAVALFDVDLWSMGPAWSLAAEEQYYLIWPFVILALGHWRKEPLSKFILLTLLAGALAIYRWIMLPAYGHERVYFGLDTHMDGLVLGSALAYLLPYLESAPNLKPALGRLLSYALAPLALLGILGFALFMDGASEVMVRYGYAVVAAASAVLILDLVYSPYCLLHGVFSSRPFVYTGKISYGLYLLHMFVVCTLHELFPHVSKLWLTPFILVFSFVLAGLSFRFWEQPFLKLKTHFESKPAPAPGAPGIAGEPVLSAALPAVAE